MDNYNKTIYKFVPTNIEICNFPKYGQCLAFGKKSSFSEGQTKIFWVLAKDYDDFQLIKDCLNEEEADRIMSNMPSIITLDWLKSVGFKW